MVSGRGFVVLNTTSRVTGKEIIQWRTLPERTSQESNTAGAVEERKAALTVSFFQRSPYCGGGIKEITVGDQDSGRGHRSLVVVCGEGQGIRARGISVSSESDQGDSLSEA